MQQYRLTFWNRFSDEQRQPPEPEEEQEPKKPLNDGVQEKEPYGSVGTDGKTADESSASGTKGERSSAESLD